MKKLVIENCPACEPVNRLIQEIEKRGNKIIESRLEDYHFHQLYIKVNGSLNSITEIDKSGFIAKGNFLFCECHWSRIEFSEES